MLTLLTASNPFDIITNFNTSEVNSFTNAGYLENTFNKLGTIHPTAKLTGKPHAVKKVLLLHSSDSLTIHYIHSGRRIEKTFTDVDACLTFALERFGVTL